MTNKQKIFVSGVALGALYVLLCYFFLGHFRALPTIAFLAGVPIVLGAVPFLFADEDQVRWYLICLFIPWTALFSALGILVATKNEGILCLVILGLPFIVLALLGSLIGWVIGAFVIRKKRAQRIAAGMLLLLPFLLAYVERTYLVREEVRTVESSVTIDAPIEAVWARLAAFDEIKPEEFEPGFWHRLGVPRPIRATVDHAALGGHRIGTFEYGLQFDELITEFEPPRKMTFTITVDPTKLRPNSTERHGLEGGYFAFIDATYALSTVENGRTMIRLSSRYRAKSSVNAYGCFWADRILGDFQDRVLSILSRRFRAPSPAVAAVSP